MSSGLGGQASHPHQLLPTRHQLSLILHKTTPAFVWLACALLCCASAAAQGGGRPGGGGGGGGPWHGGGGSGFPGGRSGFPGGSGRPDGVSGGSPVNIPGSHGGISIPANRNPLQQGPSGRWWDNNRYAKSVGLTKEQRGRMDSAFEENRAALTTGLDTLRKAQDRLDALSRSDHPSEAALLTEIQNVAQARADLQKTNTHLLLQLRNEMTAEQITRLESLR